MDSAAVFVLWVRQRNGGFLQCERVGMDERMAPNGIFGAGRNCQTAPPLGPHGKPPADLPKTIQDDFIEADRVLPFSAKASAALSRRCLQSVLLDRGGVKAGDDLSRQIQHVLDNGHLPSQLAENLDAIRNIGNFAAHPIKSQQTGFVVDVEEGEADWTLTVLDELFDYYYVKPIQSAAKREALNAKLKSAGKPAMKVPKK